MKIKLYVQLISMHVQNALSHIGTMPNVGPAAVVGVDENRRVPELVEGADVTNPELPNQPQAQTSINGDMDIDDASVNMVVVDGIVMGPTVCKYIS